MLKICNGTSSFINKMGMPLLDSCTLRWTKSGMIGVHFCVVFCVIVLHMNKCLSNYYFLQELYLAFHSKYIIEYFEWINFYQIQNFQIKNGFTNFHNFGVLKNM